MKNNLFSRLLLVLSIAVISAPAAVPQSMSERKSANPIQSLSASLAELSRKISPSVVQIRTVGYGAPKGDGVGIVTSEEGTGSGVIVDSEGYIVTNAHVVKGARRVDVWLTDANVAAQKNFQTPAFRTTPGKIVGIDPQMDIAVIKIDYPGLVPLPFGDSDSLDQGEIVVAFGNPMGLENSVTMGVISSVERQLSPDDPGIYIQTDAPINPGNSGGALVDVEGRLVGINTFILSESGGNEGLGFAIPSNVLQRAYTQIRTDGHVHHGQIGVHSLTVTPTLAAGLDLPRDWGVILEDVVPDGPGDQSGLRPGDLVLTVDGKIMKDKHQFLVSIDRHSIGESVAISVQRGTETIEAAVPVLERPDDPNRFLDDVTRKAELIPQLGVLAMDLPPAMLQRISGLRRPAGILVAARVAGSEAENSLMAGDLIISLNGSDLPDLASLKAALGGLKTGSPAVLQIQREDRLMYLTFETP